VRNEQAIFERVGLETEALRGFGTSDEVYFDRLEDQFNRLLESIDAAANAVGMVLDLQLNERAYGSASSPSSSSRSPSSRASSA
jgi:hypothetical protein